MYSMTGFGSSEVNNEIFYGKIDIKSLNHKYLDVQVKGPREFFALEEKIRKQVSKKIARGRVEIRLGLQFTEKSYKRACLNSILVQDYMEGLQEIRRMTGESEQPIMPLVFKLPEVFTLEQESMDEELLWQNIEAGLEKALNELVSMKKREGEEMKHDIENSRDKLEKVVEDIENLKERSSEKVAHRLREHLQELLNTQGIDESRIIQETALHAEKANIDEELVRMKSHLKQIKEVCNDAPPQGKKLDFVTQEMNREINTIASKSSDENISRLVIEAKSLIEKIREQVQNVE